MYSGATAVSGMALVKVNAVGEHSPTPPRLTAQAKVYKKTVSDLNKGINTILKFMTFLVVPLCILLILSQVHTVGGWGTALSTGEWRQAVVSAVAGVVGMIPEGLVLLTSLNFAVAAMRLARHNTLVQELESVETLARVDALNLDKTGTITDGGIAFNRLVMLGSANGDCGTGSHAGSLRPAATKSSPTALAKPYSPGLRPKDMGQVRLSLVSRSLRRANGARCVNPARPGTWGRRRLLFLRLRVTIRRCCSGLTSMPMTATVCCWLRGLQLPSPRGAVAKSD